MGKVRGGGGNGGICVSLFFFGGSFTRVSVSMLSVHPVHDFSLLYISPFLDLCVVVIKFTCELSANRVQIPKLLPRLSKYFWVIALNEDDYWWVGCVTVTQGY